MSDRYLCKAKRTDNGEWVEGFYAEYDKHYILMICSTCAKPPYDWYFKKIEVDPFTICQYTGLTDKNGKRIWENDILLGHLDDLYPENTTYERVLWNNNGFCTQEHCSVDVEPLDEFDQNNFEVCGNIFDNPELLGGGAK